MERAATMTTTPDESKAIALRHGPKIILSASGMATGGLDRLDRFFAKKRQEYGTD